MFQNLIPGRLEVKRVGRYAIIRNKTAFTLAEGATHVALWCNYRKIAFTLAEVLITLGIIGIVAALTMPALIDNHNKQVVVARIQKFYSTMNQAIARAEVDYGARDMWFEDNSDYESQKAWCEKYLIPYMNVIDYGKLNRYFYMTFADGSSVVLSGSNGRDWFFFPGDPKRCLGESSSLTYNCGKCSFAFYYNPKQRTDGSWYAWEFATYGKSGWDGNIDTLKSHSRYGCSLTAAEWPGYCSTWIQVNSWKIPKDYPFRVKYR